jgi:hypothetical protein
MSFSACGCLNALADWLTRRCSRRADKRRRQPERAEMLFLFASMFAEETFEFLGEFVA